VTPEIDDGSGNIMQSVYFEDLELPEPGEVVVCLRPAWVLVRLSHILEVVKRVDRVREEDKVVNKDLRFSLLRRVQRRNTSLHDSHRSLGRRVQKVVVNLGNGPVSLSALRHIVLWEILYDLVLFVQVANAFGIKAE